MAGKYVKSERVKQAMQAVEQVLDPDGTPLYRGNKLLTRDWLLNQTLRDIRQWVVEGELFFSRAAEGD